jgi:hypothetical protein
VTRRDAILERLRAAGAILCGRALVLTLERGSETREFIAVRRRCS